MFGPLKDVNSFLDPGVGGRTHGVEVTCLGATDLGSEMSGRTQQDMLGGVDVAGTSAPEYIVPSSVPQISAPRPVAPSIDNHVWPPQLSLVLYLSRFHTL